MASGRNSQVNHHWIRKRRWNINLESITCRMGRVFPQTLDWTEAMSEVEQ